MNSDELANRLKDAENERKQKINEIKEKEQTEKEKQDEIYRQNHPGFYSRIMTNYKDIMGAIESQQEYDEELIKNNDIDEIIQYCIDEITDDAIFEKLANVHNQNDNDNCDKITLLTVVNPLLASPYIGSSPTITPQLKDKLLNNSNVRVGDFARVLKLNSHKKFIFNKESSAFNGWKIKIVINDSWIFNFWNKYYRICLCK